MSIKEYKGLGSVSTAINSSSTYKTIKLRHWCLCSLISYIPNFDAALTTIIHRAAMNSNIYIYILKYHFYF